MNNPIKYSNCWEDVELLSSALKVHRNSDILSIASGGDNSLFLLSHNPNSLTCVDTNPFQIRLTKIKECAIRHLEYDEFLQMLGFQPSLHKEAILQKLRPYLLPDEIALFQQFGSESPLIDAGKFETYLRFFAQRIMPLIHTQTKIEQLFAEKNDKEQTYFYTNTWDSLRWRMFFRVFFSRFVMGRFGREPQKLKEVQVPVSKTILQRASCHLSSTLCQQNYMLEYIMRGRFITLPPYARQENFILIKSWLQFNDINYHHGDVISAISTGRKFNRYNLSNIFEYMTQVEFERHIDFIEETGGSNSIYCYWSLLVERTYTKRKALLIENTEKDLGFFYQQFHTYQFDR